MPQRELCGSFILLMLQSCSRAIASVRQGEIAISLSARRFEQFADAVDVGKWAHQQFLFSACVGPTRPTHVDISPISLAHDFSMSPAAGAVEFIRLLMRFIGHRMVEISSGTCFISSAQRNFPGVGFGLLARCFCIMHHAVRSDVLAAADFLSPLLSLAAVINC
jgi:hypothetical protein